MSEDTRLAAAPVSINPLVRMSKIKIGIRINCGRFGVFGWVRLFIDRIEFIAMFSHTNYWGGTLGWPEPYPSNIL